MNYEYFESYSSYGEDSILNGVIKRLSWLMNKDLFEQNTYIDIGSFHPVRESNTYFLYKKGWFGTLVDPNSYFNAIVHEERPNDILYNCAVDTEEGTKEFYMFGNIDSSNTLSAEFAERKRSSQHTDISWVAQVPTKTLNDIINIHIQYFQKTPFFLNIDIEGKDFVEPTKEDAQKNKIKRQHSNRPAERENIDQEVRQKIQSHKTGDTNHNKI